jgi:hypothetical protein
MSGKRLISRSLIAILFIIVVSSLRTNTVIVFAEPNAPTSGTLTVYKNVINNNGGSAIASEFTINVSGLNASPASFPGDAAGTPVTLDAGSYDVTEDPFPGYSTTFSAGCSGSITDGESITCTVTNDDIQPQLTLVKNVVNDNGGPLTVANFPLFVDATSVDSGVSNGFNAGIYTASETQQTGYAASNWGGDCASNGSITLNVGDDKTCTITNDDIQPTLTLVKNVVNDDGGILNVEDFPLFVDATSVDSGVANGFNAGTYTASETQQSGYAASIWSGDCASNGSITLSVGDNKTCTITNNDIGATLTLIKSVSNNNGGTALAADFQAFIDGSPVTWNVAQPVTPGLHAATEALLPGYSASVWGIDCAIDGSITIALGENKTCAITNDDVQPSLTVIKQVINDNGRTSTASDFTINITGTNVSLPSFPGAVSPGTTVFLDAGIYDVTETPVTGYTVSYSPDCSGTIAIGESKTCTITNNDSLPMVTFAPDVVSQIENVPIIVVRAQLDALSSNEITVPFNISSGSTATLTDDYTITASPLVIPAGFLNANITITIVNDFIYENDESIVLTMDTPTNADLGLVTTATATIEDDEKLKGLADHYEVEHSNVLTVKPRGVLINDPIDTNVSVSLQVVTGGKPQNGFLNLKDDGSFRYTPDPGFVGQDSFQYSIKNNDNNDASPPIIVTINVFDPTSPSVQWELPVENGQQYEVRCEDITLAVDASDDIKVDYVVLTYYDYVAFNDVEIDILFHPPYSTTFSTCELNPEFNQINAVAYDNSGNDSGYPAFIWLYRYAHTIYLPTLGK